VVDSPDGRDEQLVISETGPFHFLVVTSQARFRHELLDGLTAHRAWTWQQRGGEYRWLWVLLKTAAFAWPHPWANRTDHRAFPLFQCGGVLNVTGSPADVCAGHMSPSRVRFAEDPFPLRHARKAE
jgi:hypothetical protein